MFLNCLLFFLYCFYFVLIFLYYRHKLCQLSSVTLFEPFLFLSPKEHRSKGAAGESKAEHTHHPCRLKGSSFHNKAYSQQGGCEYGCGQQGRINGAVAVLPADSGPGAGRRQKAECRADKAHGPLPGTQFCQHKSRHAQQCQRRDHPHQQCGKDQPGIPCSGLTIRQQKNTPRK